MCIVIYMKSSKRDPTYAQRKNAGKKSGEKGGSVKLDRKSSRGMIYENEELRLRTININAEVERGQSDIRKLRRENEQLRREIWSLRDEYDRLNKRFKANKYLPDSISEHGQSESNSEDSDSCDTCRGEADINEDCLIEQHDSGRQSDNFPSLPTRQQYDRCSSEVSTCKGEPLNEQGSSTTSTEISDNSTASKSRDHLHVNFDHLSIVSEENLSNSDGNLTQSELNQQQQQQSHSYYFDENFIEIDGSRLSPSQCMGAMSLPSLVGPLTPMTPIELVANQLNDLQSIVPPLSYFENVVQQHMGTTIISTADSNASTNTGDTVIHTNGWDYNIQSPFVHRKFQASDPSSSNSTSTTMSPPLPNNPLPTRDGTPQLDASTNAKVSNPDAYKNLKHFFSPIKPRLKLDTALAAKAAILAAPPTTSYLEQLHQNCDPPDVYITNALASPYYPQPLAGLSLPSVLEPPVQQSCVEPIYATAQKKTLCSEQSLATATSSKSSVNLEQILSEIGTISEDILQMQLEKSRSQEKLTTESYFFTKPALTNASVTTTPLHTATAHTQTLSSTSSPINFPKEQQHQDKNRKPYRSEMNLLLSYNGSNPVIIPLAKNSAGGGVSTSEAAQVLVVDQGTAYRDGNSPSPPQLPTPMAPFPTNLMYLGFDRLNQHLSGSGEVPCPDAKTGLQYILPQPSEVTDQHATSPPVPTPAPPIQDTSKTDNTNVFCTRGQEALYTTLAISSPELSTSPLSEANLPAIAPLKRRIFSRQNGDGSSSQLTRSFDGGDVNTMKIDSKQQPCISLPEAVRGKLLLEANTNEISSYESSSGSEATKRKTSRRVSIVCREEKSERNTDTNERHHFEQQPSSTSVDKLDDMTSSIIANLKQAHSTPNSPHSNRRWGGNTNSAISVNSGSTTLHHHGHHHHHHHHHHHNRKMSQESLSDARGTSVANSIVNISQDDVLGGGTIAPSHHHSSRYKCSRRHSEGTVSSMVGDRGGGGTVGPGTRISSTGNHHHPQDSNQETGTSISERNSGSLASSRESSTSLSMRSQRRKISVSSHTGGKIPWCGCWGNGCL